jgi:hypothetical protein
VISRVRFLDAAVQRPLTHFHLVTVGRRDSHKLVPLGGSISGWSKRFKSKNLLLPLRSRQARIITSPTAIRVRHSTARINS